MEDIKSAKGNTEANSLKQARSIIRDGFYELGFSDGRNKKDEMVGNLLY